MVCKLYYNSWRNHLACCFTSLPSPTSSMSAEMKPLCAFNASVSSDKWDSRRFRTLFRVISLQVVRTSLLVRTRVCSLFEILRPG